ncbi:MAG: PucR family transcriptional regulator, partial [Solirubrobacterales bacterium]
PLLCAVIDGEAGDAIELARRARRALAAEHGTARAAASRDAPVESVRRGFHEARCALEATSLADGDAPEVASHRDLGAFTLLLALQDEDALRSYSDSLLAPIEADGRYGSELLRSLEAYIEQNGQWERAARELYCHRHTLRYRIRRVEELTGRDLSTAHDRIELWLALRAKELVR